MLRLILLRVTRRPLLSPAVPERDIDPAAIPDSAASSPTLAPSSPPTSPLTTPDHLKNNRVPLPPHSLLTPPPPSREPDTSIEDFLLPKALTTASVKPPLSLIRGLASPRDWLSETLYIVRPLIYGKSGLSSWNRPHSNLGPYPHQLFCFPEIRKPIVRL
jgi:peroxin-16